MNNEKEIQKALDILDAEESGQEYVAFFLYCPVHKNTHVFNYDTDPACTDSLRESIS